MYKLTLLLSRIGVADLGKKVLEFSCHTGITEEAPGVKHASESFLKTGDSQSTIKGRLKSVLLHRDYRGAYKS